MNTHTHTYQIINLNFPLFKIKSLLFLNNEYVLKQSSDMSTSNDMSSCDIYINDKITFNYIVTYQYLCT